MFFKSKEGKEKILSLYNQKLAAIATNTKPVNK